MATDSKTESNARRGQRKTYESPLANIEFNAASDIIKYADTMRIIGRSMQLELHTAADELQAVLTGSAGGVFERASARRKAKKVSNYLRKAGDHARAVSISGVQLSRAFRREYAPLLDPPKQSSKNAINWRE